MADNFNSRQAPIGQTATCVAVTQTIDTIQLLQYITNYTVVTPAAVT